MKGREASLAARLKRAAISKGISFQYATLLYMHEGLLRRLAGSVHRKHFALKGGLLLQSLSESGGRSTKDIDLLGSEIENDVENLRAIFTSIVRIEADDALRFDDEAMEVEAIVEGAEYHGVRIRMPCYLGTIRNGIQIDVGFGDAVEPPLREIPYPILVDGSAFSLYSYPLAAVVAEKFETMLSLGSVNSRMKDFFDIAFILNNYEVSDDDLRAAIRTTILRRGTEMPEQPDVFSPAFSSAGNVPALWKAFLKRTRLGDIELDDVLETIRSRLEPIYREVRSKKSFPN